jgi:hypothetical protein
MMLVNVAANKAVVCNTLILLHELRTVTLQAIIISKHKSLAFIRVIYSMK